MTNIKINIVNNDEQQIEKFPVRYWQYILMFFTIVISFIIRSSLSVALIEMTSKTPPDPKIPTYPDWNNTDIILSSFFWGYVIAQIIAGQVSEYFGPKWFIFTVMVICALIHAAIPFVANWSGSTGVIVCRVLEGLNQAFLYPGTQHLVSRWSPLSERARVSGFVFSGAALGNTISMPIIGAIVSSKLGWPSSFYIIGGIGLVWSLVFVIFIKNSPWDHNGISEKEKLYITESTSVSPNKKLPTPWMSIATSIPVWAIVISASSQCWGSYTLLSEIPNYMSNIMKYNMKSNGLVSALPYLANLLMGFAVSPIADILITKNFLSVTATRKLFGGISSFVPGAFLIGLAFIDKSQKELAVVLLVVAVSFTAFALCGYIVNIIDIAPNFSGTILGIVNTIGYMFSIMGPITVGLLGDDKTDIILWRKVFLIAAGFHIVGGILYVVFTSAELQPWNNLEKRETQESTENVIEQKPVVTN